MLSETFIVLKRIQRDIIIFHHRVEVYKDDVKRCVINASISRIRPILLTVATTVLGLIHFVSYSDISKGSTHHYVVVTTTGSI
jgi:Cu/Ag efflux pump CusA